MENIYFCQEGDSEGQSIDFRFKFTYGRSFQYSANKMIK